MGEKKEGAGNAQRREHSAALRAKLPWQWRIAARTLVIVLPTPYFVLGWAPMGGGLRRAEVILNHQIALDNTDATDSPATYLRRLARRLGFAPQRTAAMMTGANVARGGFAAKRRGALAVSAWCSAGCTNALRVGDRATAPSRRPGTINIAVAINQPLTVGALTEAIQIAVEGRVLAVQEARVVSRRSGRPATGTGTDCIVVAAPDGSDTDTGHVIEYCGKHTVAGELIGRAVMRSCADALHRCSE